MSFTPANTTVWIELPVRDLAAASAFYSKVTGLMLERQQMGPNETAIFQAADFATGVAGHLYEGTPAGDGTGPTVHLAAQGKLEDTMARVAEAGFRSGVVYDALHVRCAERSGCDRIITYNIGDFERLVRPGMEVVTP